MGGKWLAKLAQNALREGRFMFQRHCERSEASTLIFVLGAAWIASLRSQ
jgi:hypothetical protein